MFARKEAEPRACKRVWAQDVNVAAAVMETKVDELRASTATWTPAQQAIEDGVRSDSRPPAVRPCAAIRSRAG